MKKRSGFVSNSSVSSFIIVGVEYNTTEDVQKLLERFGKEFNEKEYEDDPVYYLEKVLEETSLTIKHDNYTGEITIGQCPFGYWGNKEELKISKFKDFNKIIKEVAAELKEPIEKVRIWGITSSNY